jgi:hypothetical protein
VIELSKDTRLLRGANMNFSSNNTPTVTMSHRQRKRRSEAQARHSALLHKSHCDPVAYYATSLGEVTNTVEIQRERARIAEVDAKNNKKALVRAQNQARLLASTDGKAVNSDLPGHLATRKAEFKGINDRQVVPVSRKQRD